MKVEIRKNPLREEPAVIIETPVLTAQVEEMARRLEEMDDGTIPGWREERAFLLETARLVCLYAQDKGVYASPSALRAGGEAGQPLLCPYFPFGDHQSEKGHRTGPEAVGHHPHDAGGRVGMLCVQKVCEENQAGAGIMRGEIPCLLMIKSGPCPVS